MQTGTINIQLATLQQAGAYIDNKPITPQSTMLLSNQPDKLTFDVQQLNDYLTLVKAHRRIQHWLV